MQTLTSDRGVCVNFKLGQGAAHFRTGHLVDIIGLIVAFVLHMEK